MKTGNSISINIFFIAALVMLILGLSFGVIAALNYVVPAFTKDSISFISLRPLHTFSVMVWILLGATACVYNGLFYLTKKTPSTFSLTSQFILWIIAIFGVAYSYLTQQFGGREYWEFPPFWSLFIALAWLLLLFNFTKLVRSIKDWPVYIWMWMTGILFFLFIFIENYLWLIPYFRENLITDMTIQWKVNGSLVGSWNQILYGTAFFLMDKITENNTVSKSKLAFAMYFLGLFNLMFNWGHHIYTLPTAQYIKYIGYMVSMTEWIIFVRIIYLWKATVTDIQKHYHYFPYRFLMAADIWVFINLFMALLMSIPAINLFTHGTHITVAHAMSTTIGINSMILFAAAFEFSKTHENSRSIKRMNYVFWIAQILLLTFVASLVLAGINKALWQMASERMSFSKMMESLHPWFVVFTISGIALSIALSYFSYHLIKSFKNKLYSKNGY